MSMAHSQAERLQRVNNKERVLLLLSGGKDSHEALRRLLEQGYEVHALCIDGKQGKEKVGATQAAQKYGVPLHIHNISWFDEETWHFWLLIKRDLAMNGVTLKMARELKVKAIATGVKRSDVLNPKLWWLGLFLYCSTFVAKLFGFKVLSPVWELRQGAPKSL